MRDNERDCDCNCHWKEEKIERYETGIKLCDIKLIANRAKSILIAWNGTEIWLPKSFIIMDNTRFVNQFTIWVPSWLAEEKGL